DAARARAAQQRATLRDLYGGNPGRVPEYIREMARIDEDLARDLKLAREAWARQWTLATQDLDVRMARAQGSAGADDLAIYRQQQREMDDAIRNGADITY